jgi:hypothetical protein
MRDVMRKIPGANLQSLAKSNKQLSDQGYLKKIQLRYKNGKFSGTSFYVSADPTRLNIFSKQSKQAHDYALIFINKFFKIRPRTRFKIGTIFKKIPNHITQSTILLPVEKLILIYAIEKPQKWIFHASKMAQLFKVCRATIKQATLKLQKLGFFILQTGKKIKTCLFPDQIFKNKQSAAENQGADQYASQHFLRDHNGMPTPYQIKKDTNNGLYNLPNYPFFSLKKPKSNLAAIGFGDTIFKQDFLKTKKKDLKIKQQQKMHNYQKNTTNSTFKMQSMESVLNKMNLYRKKDLTTDFIEDPSTQNSIISEIQQYRSVLRKHKTQFNQKKPSPNQANFQTEKSNARSMPFKKKTPYNQQKRPLMNNDQHNNYWTQQKNNSKQCDFYNTNRQKETPAFKPSKNYKPSKKGLEILADMKKKLGLKD